jgi:short-subunit dehydrogenase
VPEAKSRASSTRGRSVALITGASGGIGAELAKVCAAKGHALALVARNGDKMSNLARTIGESGGAAPIVIPLDLASPSAGAELVACLARAGATPEILVNNAGYGLLGAAGALEIAGQIGIIDLNIRALSELTLRFLPSLIANRGRILNVASLAAFLPGPGMAIYYASKAYVLSFSQALAEELKGAGVVVTALCPGPVPTGFGERAGTGEDLAGGSLVVDAAEVARYGYRAMMAGRRVAIPGRLNQALATLLPLVPTALKLPVLAGIQMRRRAR